jgi:RimJ/RimL family protein N-acetyltransferase
MGIHFKLVDSNYDLELIFSWRQNPLIYKYFLIQSSPLLWENHVDFWNEYKNRIDWMIYYDSRRIWSVYFKIINNVELDIGVYVADINLRNKGVGDASIKFAIDWALNNNFKQITACVHLENISSIKLFTKNNFILADVLNSNFSIYKLNL